MIDERLAREYVAHLCSDIDAVMDVRPATATRRGTRPMKRRVSTPHLTAGSPSCRLAPTQSHDQAIAGFYPTVGANVWVPVHDSTFRISGAP